MSVKVALIPRCEGDVITNVFMLATYCRNLRFARSSFKIMKEKLHLAFPILRWNFQIKILKESKVMKPKILGSASCFGMQKLDSGNLLF